MGECWSFRNWCSSTKTDFMIEVKMVDNFAQHRNSAYRGQTETSESVIEVGDPTQFFVEPNTAGNSEIYKYILGSRISK